MATCPGYLPRLPCPAALPGCAGLTRAQGWSTEVLASSLGFSHQAEPAR
jgi:hypothetical protein